MKALWLETKFPLVCFGITLVFLWMGDFLESHFSIRAIPFTLICWTLSAIPIAVSFYRMRRKSRLYYGIFEFLAACALLYSTMLAIIHHNPNALIVETLTARGLTFFAMIYSW
jgi:hypothetical protein